MNVPLIIAPETRALAQKVVNHAKQPDHWLRYDVEGELMNTELSGDPKFSCTIPMAFYCVFTYAHHPDGTVYRVLSMQIPGQGLPNQYKAGELALMFGFTGWNREGPFPLDWHILFPVCSQWVSVMQEVTCVQL